jgi:hypothetical protein
VFLTMIVIGLVGLVMMALPALGGHHLPPTHGHGGGAHDASLAATVAAAASHAHPTALPTHAASPPTTPATHVVATAAATANHIGHRFVPSPRAVFSVLALYGASGNALVHAGHLSRHTAALIAIGPALLVERLLIRPVWNLMFRFRAAASSPLGELILAEAHAVVPFRNGRGLITTIRDGRRIQLHAQLCDQDATVPVAVGQRLRIEDVDARRERATVSVITNESALSNQV